MNVILSNQIFKHHNKFKDRLVVDNSDVRESEKPGMKSYSKFIGIVLACFGFASRLKAKNAEGKITVYYVNTKSYKNWIQRENSIYRFPHTLDSIDAIVQAVTKQKEKEKQEQNNIKQEEAALTEAGKKLGFEEGAVKTATESSKVKLAAAKIVFAKNCKEFEENFPASWMLRTPLKDKYLSSLEDFTGKACFVSPEFTEAQSSRYLDEETQKEFNEFKQEVEKYKAAQQDRLQPTKNQEQYNQDLKQFYQKKGIDANPLQPLEVDEASLGLDLDEKQIDNLFFSSTKGQGVTLKDSVRGIVKLVSMDIEEKKNSAPENERRIIWIERAACREVGGSLYLGCEEGASQQDCTEKRWGCRVLNKLVEKEYIYAWYYRGDSHVIQA